MKDQWAKELIVRGEKAADYAVITEINNLAFGREDEAKLIEDIRKTKNYEFGFSLVAVKEEVILGHALFSKAFVVHKGRRFKCLALGPIAVLPDHQRKGIGKALIAEGFERAKEVGFGAVVVLGDPAYYEQFGFKPSTAYKVRCSFSKNPEHFMVKEISRNALRGIIGTVQYAREYLVLAQADEKRAEEKAKLEAVITNDGLPFSDLSVNPVVNEVLPETQNTEPENLATEQNIQTEQTIQAEQKPEIEQNLEAEKTIEAEQNTEAEQKSEEENTNNGSTGSVI